MLPVQALSLTAPLPPMLLPKVSAWLFHSHLLQLLAHMSPCVKLYNLAHCPTDVHYFPFLLYLFLLELITI